MKISKIIKKLELQCSNLESVALVTPVHTIGSYGLKWPNPNFKYLENALDSLGVALDNLEKIK